MSGNNHYKGWQQLLNKRPKRVIFFMIAILLLGIVLIFIRRSNSGPGHAEPIEKLIESFDTTDIHRKGSIDYMGEFYDVIQLEGETKRILQKDTLTREDSLFLKEVNKKLNRMLDEKN